MADGRSLEERLEALERRLEAAQREVAHLRKENAALKERVRDLESRLRKSSFNSSMPPSADPPWAPTREKAPTGRRPGGQPGHRGRTRRLFDPEEVDEVVAVAPARCGGCGRSLQRAASTGRDVVHQVVDLPATAARVTEYRCEERRCGCGETTRAALPEGVPTGAVGPGLQAVVALLPGRYRVSRREAKEAVEALYGPNARLALGTVVALERRTAGALEGIHAEARDAVRRTAVVHADETLWREGARKAWLWSAVTRALAVFHVDPERSREAFRRLMGPCRGTLVTDRWGSYHSHPPTRRRICWAHLKRNFQELAERKDGASILGRAGLKAGRAVMEAWWRFRDGGIGQGRLKQIIQPIRKRSLRTVLRHVRNPVPIAAAT
ncbi:MAG: transposase [Planctomycetes bacterium]|nr:transposase [Planctomycetota bacterium]